jgi:glycosyltransferase involved in cell wall biosynthesis
MKVLIVTPSYLPIIGGSEILARTLSIKLNELRIRTDIMAFNMDKTWNPTWGEKIERDGSFSVFKIPALNPFSTFPINPFYHSLRIHVLPKPHFKNRFREYDIIHFLGEADLTFPILSCSIQKPKIMHCVAVKGLYAQYQVHRSRILKKIFTRVFPRLADLYMVSSYDEVKVLTSLGVPQRKILILPYGIDTKIYRPDERKKHDDLILFVGRIDENKGLHVLLESLSYLSFKTQVAIIGPRLDNRYFEKIRKKCHKISEEGVHTVKYLGRIRRDDLVPWYQMATVLVRPDLLGVSGGLTGLEALACGTPVIGTGNHVVIHNVNGIIVLSNNPKELARALYKLLVDKKLREKYGREGRKIIEQVFSWKPIVTRLIRVYEKMLDDQCRMTK